MNVELLRHYSPLQLTPLEASTPLPALVRFTFRYSQTPTTLRVPSYHVSCSGAIYTQTDLSQIPPLFPLARTTVKTLKITETGPPVILTTTLFSQGRGGGQGANICTVSAPLDTGIVLVILQSFFPLVCQIFEPHQLLGCIASCGVQSRGWHPCINQMVLHSRLVRHTCGARASNYARTTSNDHLRLLEDRRPSGHRGKSCLSRAVVFLEVPLPR